MNDKQKRFCEEYVVTLNGAQSAINAGYSERTARQKAYELLSQDNIQDFIQELQEKKSKELNITFEDVVSQMYDIATNADRDGDRIKALEQTAKLLGFYEKDNLQSSVKVNSTPTVIRFEDVRKLNDE